MIPSKHFLPGFATTCMFSGIDTDRDLLVFFLKGSFRLDRKDFGGGGGGGGGDGLLPALAFQ